MSGTEGTVLYYLVYSLHQPNEVTVIPILQMRKLKLWEVNQLAYLISGRAGIQLQGPHAEPSF